ncbi:MAG: glutamate/gamma-aminobutyrate family transporter YjeM [Epulopiscium sp. Nele67-Bin004]|nr:MAG: glutamate/gamma-aminobutyrate family transporter YjeM [Epulopiscium sp. Nele67-Bin004]
MEQKKQHTKKLTLVSLILMIFTSVYGFANIPRAYYLMGYSAIPWYVLGAVLFFVPYALMLSEYGAAFKKETGGIFSWMKWSVGPKYAFIGTFMWYAAFIVWQVNISSSIWVPLSNALYGQDVTGNLTFLGLRGPQVLGLMGMLWVLGVTVITSFGIDKIKQITSVGGIAVLVLNVVLWAGAISILLINDGQVAQPILSTSLTQTPNPRYASPLSQLAFFTFAIFAYGGIEAVAGLVDQTDKAEKTFPRGVVIASAVISIGYAIGIMLIGIFTNWQDVLSSSGINSANITYVIMNNLGYTLSLSFGFSKDTAMEMGMWMARFAGITMFLALTGAFFTLSYAPLKQLLDGTPAGLWPKRFTDRKNHVPVHALYVQAALVIALIYIVSFGGQSTSMFFDKLIVMTNVAMTLPYMFLSIAFPFFKRNKAIKKPFEVYKSYSTAVFASVIVSSTLGVANAIAIIEPWLARGVYVDTLLSAGGPIFFGILAFAIYSRYEHKHPTAVKNKKTHA